jgi:hypothetical protein
MTFEEIKAVLDRPGGPTKDPTMLAVMEFVESMCDVATREATGFHNAATCNRDRDVARAKFVLMMEQAAVPTEG